MRVSGQDIISGGAATSIDPDTHGEQEYRSGPPLNPIDIVLAYFGVGASEQLDKEICKDGAYRCRGREQEESSPDLDPRELLG
jgi:hypothetical protein